MAANRTIDYLDTLIAFPTVSRDSNLALIEYIRHEFDMLGIDSTLVPSEDGRKVLRGSASASPAAPEGLGRRLAEALLEQGAASVTALRPEAPWPA